MTLTKEEMKQAFKEAVREELKDVRAFVGDWALRLLAVMTFSLIFYLWLFTNGWVKR